MHMMRALYAKLICGSDQTWEPELLLSYGTMNKAHTATLRSSIARLWRFTLRSLIDFSLKMHVLVVRFDATRWKETAFKRISQIKQVLDLRQGGAAAHGSTNSIILYFSQDLRSPDQFSASKQTQPVHLQHHPTCHSNMSLQHVTTLSLIFHAIRGYPLFHTQREIDDGFVQSSWRNCMCQDRQHTMVTRRRASVLLHAWCCKNGDGCPTNLRFRNPFQIWSFLLLQPRHMIYLNVHALRIQNVHHFGNMICGFRIHI